LTIVQKTKENDPKWECGPCNDIGRCPYPVINHTMKCFYGHFWIEYNDCIYDIATETYLLDYAIDKHDEMKKNMRILVKSIPEKLKHEYKNIDDPLFEIIRNESYLRCMENKMLEDVKEKAPLEIYNKIKFIHDKLIY
jgi:hypothetical protein